LLKRKVSPTSSGTLFEINDLSFRPQSFPSEFHLLGVFLGDAVLLGGAAENSL
jgi:hypothetical protein